MPDTPENTDPYDQENLRNIRAAMKRIRKDFEDSIFELALTASFIVSTDVVNLAEYPLLLQRIEQAIKRMHATIYTTIVNSIQAGWNTSNLKNNVLVDKRLAGKVPVGKVRMVLYDPNRNALAAFIKRTEGGLTLSDRVWNGLAPMRAEMEAGLAVGISEGDSAASMATRMKRYLLRADDLFRRVRNSNGKLVLSKAAEAYKPGQGNYRSSYKNALRLTATETNAAYRKADIERWKTIPFIKGYRIVLSNQHPKYDICDELNKSIYPKDFVWTGWHPFCLCHMVAVQISDAEYEKYEDAILATGQAPKVDVETETPKAFDNWVTKNAERINGWKNLPHWARDNPKYVSKLLK